MSLLHQVGLTFIRNIGPTLSRALLSYFGSAEAIFNASTGKLLKVPGIGAKTLEQLDFNAALNRAERELVFMEREGVDAIFFTDSRYPKRLKNCNDAPILLYSRGNADFNPSKVVSIVGTRNATDYGKQLCRQLIEELQQYHVLAVSGLALGIDVAAHKESIKVNLPTVGVLAHGLDRIYPAQNKNTAEKMLLNGGLLTEYPSGTIPERENFPQRNRIVAGMADATVVIEAGLKGGALITAEIANSYNRDVFAFPGKITDEFSEGCNFLIRNNKAALLSCVADLAYSLGWEKTDGAVPIKEQLTLAIDLLPDERLIYDTIHQHKAAISVDDLAIKSNLPMSQLAMNLLNMEMQGFIRSLPGKMYRIN